MKKKSKIENPKFNKEDLPEEFDGAVRRRFKRWKKDHPVVGSSSSSIKDPTELIVIMSNDPEDDA